MEFWLGLRKLMDILRKLRYNIYNSLDLVFKYIIDLETEGRKRWIVFWLFQVPLSQNQYEDLQTEGAR